jgi:iron-sulfur cluster repair protein YtfE (RIC family)
MIKESIQRLGFFLRKLTQRKLDVLDQLEEEHIRVEMLFFQWKLSRTEASKKRIFDKLKESLLFHIHREESLFYPACAKIPELKLLINENYEEHRHIKVLLKELSGMSQTAERTASKMRVLLQEVEHHVTEEENGLFPQVRALMKKGQFNKLSRTIRMARQQKIQRHKTAA